MRLRLLELQNNNEEAKVLRSSAELLEGWEDIKTVLQYQSLPYISELIHSEVINCHQNDFLIGHFGIDKTRELVAWKYYWPSLSKNVEIYVQGYDICLTSKAVRHKLYEDLQSLPILTHK